MNKTALVLLALPLLLAACVTAQPAGSDNSHPHSTHSDHSMSAPSVNPPN